MMSHTVEAVRTALCRSCTMFVEIDGCYYQCYSNWTTMPEVEQQQDGGWFLPGACPKESFRFFVGIEATWHISLFAICYRYRPLRRLTRTKAGQRLMNRIQNMNIFGTSTSTTTKKIKGPRRKGAWENYLPGGRRTLVTVSECFVLNKIFGLPLLPTKLLLAGWMSKQYKKHGKSILPEWLQQQMERLPVPVPQQEEENAEDEIDPSGETSSIQ